MRQIKLNTIILSFFCLLLLVGSSACKSHKKVKNDESVYIGETVDIKSKKKGKKESGIRKKIAEESIEWIGTPYGYGCNQKGVATDCSGLVLVLYEEIANIKLPRMSSEQADFCDELKEKEIEAGDLVFFATGKNKKKVSHVGVMIDNCKFVHASASKGVIMSEMTTPYYQRTFIKFGRVPKSD